MSDNTGDLGFAARTNLTVETLDKVETTGPELPSPAEVTNAVLPVFTSGEGREGSGAVTDEAADGMGVETKHERDEQVVGVPEGLETLLADLGVGSGIHHHHAEKHDVTGNTTGLLVVNVQSGTGTELSPLNVVETTAAQVSKELERIRRPA